MTNKISAGTIARSVVLLLALVCLLYTSDAADE